MHDCGHASNLHFSHMTDDELAKVGFLVDQFNRGQVSPAWRRAVGIDCYVMDVEVVSQKTGHSDVRLIELNTFGAEFSSGSALYHWVRDDHILQAYILKAEKVVVIVYNVWGF